MKTFLEILNENLGTNYKNISEFAEANSKKEIDMKKLGETIFQYIKYQDAVASINHRAYKTEVIIEKDKE